MGRWPFLACVVVACGNGPEEVLDAGADATANDAAADTSRVDAVTDVVVEHVPSVVLTDGGPFLCMGCICNGTDHECIMLGHVLPLSPVDGGFDDAATCDQDAGGYGCVPIPADCMPMP